MERGVASDFIVCLQIGIAWVNLGSIPMAENCLTCLIWPGGEDLNTPMPMLPVIGLVGLLGVSVIKWNERNSQILIVFPVDSLGLLAMCSVFVFPNILYFPTNLFVCIEATLRINLQVFSP